jgi:uncharacterized protein YjbI with pentapeptide repeats
MGQCRVRTPAKVGTIVPLVLLALGDCATAAILDWRTGQPIRNAEQIIPIAGIDLSGWSLSYADLANLNLSASRFRGTNLMAARLKNSDLSHAHFVYTSLDGADLSNSDLTGADFEFARLYSANMTGAMINGANFQDARGFSKEMLYSTASFQNHDLSGVRLENLNLTGWSFADIDLAGVSFRNSSLGGADFSRAAVRGTDFYQAMARGFTSAQLYSTASYHTKDMSEIDLGGNDLSGFDFSNVNLTGAAFDVATLAGARFDGAIVAGVSFDDTTSRGFTKEQLYSTASYASGQLSQIDLSRNDLADANFSQRNLTGAAFISSSLDGSNLGNANLTSANFHFASLHGASLRDSDLTNAFFYESNLHNVDFSGATIAGAAFWDATWNGFTKEQLYSTASYQRKDLAGITLQRSNMSGWNFAGFDLTGAHFTQDWTELSGADFSNANLRGADFLSASVRGANFSKADLTNASFYTTRVAGADFTDAVITGAGFYLANSYGFTKEQLTSTASYKTGNLQRVGLNGNDLTDLDFSGFDLTGALFSGAKLEGANFTGAIVMGAGFNVTTQHGFTKEQLYSTASYQAKQLSGIVLGSDVSGWSFRDIDLTDASFSYSALAGADFSNAVIARAAFNGTTEMGFAAEQLYSTRSYQLKDLEYLRLGANDLTSWDFSNCNLRSVFFGGSVLTNADFSGADLSFAELNSTHLANVEFSASTIWGVILVATTERGFTKEQLYSTASYANKELGPIWLGKNDLTGWDLSGQNMKGARFWYLDYAVLTGTNFSGADLRHALSFRPVASTDTRNAIFPDGAVQGLRLEDNEVWLVRNDPLEVTVGEEMILSAGAIVELALDHAQWQSTLKIWTDVIPQLGGTLRISVASDAISSLLPGTTYQFFEWSSPLLSGNQFDAIEVPTHTQWDFSNLYSTGEAVLVSVPEPASLIATAIGACSVAIIVRLRRRRLSRPISLASSLR